MTDLLDINQRTNGTCLALKVGAFDRRNRLVNLTTGISVNLSTVNDRGATGTFYLDSCGGTINSITLIGASYNTSPIFFYNQTAPGFGNVIFNAVDGTTDLEGAYQPTTWDN